MIQTHVPQQTASKSGDKRRNRQTGRQTKTVTGGNTAPGRLGPFPSVFQPTTKAMRHVKSLLKPRSAWNTTSTELFITGYKPVPPFQSASCTRVHSLSQPYLAETIQVFTTLAIELAMVVNSCAAVIIHWFYSKSWIAVAPCQIWNTLHPDFCFISEWPSSSCCCCIQSLFILYTTQCKPNWAWRQPIVCL